MNEFDVVRGIGADTPDPDAATTNAARARLLAAIHAEAATSRPAVTDTAVDPGARRLARTPRRPHRRRRLLPASAAVAAMLAAALAVPLILQHPTPPTRQQEAGTGVTGDLLAPAEPAAVKLLTTAAVAAARTHEPPLGPGQYWYVRERGTQVGTNNDGADWPKSFSWRMPYENQTWWAIDGDTRHRETFGRPQFLSPADRAAWVANGRPKLPGQEVRTFDENPGTSDRSDGYLPLTYKQIVDLPTDPARLTDALSKRIYAGQPNESCPTPPGLDVAAVRCPHRPVTDLDRYGAIVFLVTSYPLPAELRSALYQALTRLDGIELTGEVSDLAGRRGVGVTMGPLEEELMPRRTVLIFDPASGRLLGSRSVLAADVPSRHLTRGTVMEESTMLEMSVVDSPSARPKTGP
ncbi:MAG TPA: CU044_5270 family protein [Streptosporangiaceae bacterium]